MPQPPVPPERLAELASQLASPKPMRRGSLSERYVKCSKPGCPCAERSEARHGPYFSLTRGVLGQTRSRFLTPEQAKIAERQIEAARRFREQLEAYWRGCEEWADEQLEQLEAPSGEGAKKGASGRPSKRRSSGRSRLS